MAKYPNLTLKRGMLMEETDTFVFRDKNDTEDNTQDMAPHEPTFANGPVDHINTAYENAVLDFALTGNDVEYMEQAALDFALTGNPDF